MRSWPRRPTARQTALLGLAAAVALVTAAGWLAWTALQARHDLETARANGGEVRAALVSGEQDRARAALQRARSSAASAHHLTDGPLWAAAAALPVIGDVAATSRGVAAAADGVVAGPVSTLIATADAVNPRQLLAPGGRVAVDRLGSVARPLTTAAEEMAVLRDDVAALPAHTVVAAVNTGRSDLLRQLTDLHRTVADAARMARIAPDVLGAHGPRRYLLVFENPAEARGTGGMLGAYGLLEARRGKVHIVRMGSNTDLRSFPAPVVDLGAEYDDRYRGFGATNVWNQANPSPHFPDAARIWMAMWRQQTGQRLDGVIATDPVAMGYLLDATGPVRLRSGQVISGANAAQVTLRDAYARFAGNTARDAYFQRIAHAVLTKVLGGGDDPVALVKQLGRAAGERRLLVYSRHPATEKELADAAVGGVLSDRPGPFASLVVNSIDASKLDYYLDRSLRYTALGSCRGGSRHTRVTVQLTNTAPKHGLPAYVVNHVDQPSRRWPASTEKLLASVFLARDASMDAVYIDGTKGLAGVSLERGHTVVTLTLEIRPGQTRTVRIDVTEPASPAGPVVPVQPLVRPQRTAVNVPRC